MGLSGLAGLGLVAGGAATGLQQGAEMRRREEEEKRRKEQYEYDKENRDRQKRIRDATSAELAVADKDVPVDYQIQPGATGNLDEGGAFTPVMQRRTQEEAWKRASGAAAKAGATPQEVADLEQKGLSLRHAQRQEGDQKLADQSLALIRAIQADPQNFHKYFLQGAQLYKAIPDGKHASLSEDGQHFVLYDENSGTSQLHPATAENAVKALQHLYDLSSPQAYRQAQDRGLKEREVAAHEANSRRQEQFYQPGGVYERTHDRSINAQLRLAQAQMGSKVFTPVGSLTNGTPVNFNAHSGRYHNAFTGVPLNEGELKLFPKTTGMKGTMQPIGQTGLMTDGERLFHFDDRSGRLLEVPTPQSLGQLAAGLRQNLPGAGQPGQPQGSGLRSTNITDWLPTTDRRAALMREIGSDLTGGNATLDDIINRGY